MQVTARLRASKPTVSKGRALPACTKGPSSSRVPQAAIPIVRGNNRATARGGKRMATQARGRISRKCSPTTRCTGAWMPKNTARQSSRARPATSSSSPRRRGGNRRRSCHTERNRGASSSTAVAWATQQRIHSSPSSSGCASPQASRLQLPHRPISAGASRAPKPMKQTTSPSRHRGTGVPQRRRISPAAQNGTSALAKDRVKAGSKGWPSTSPWASSTPRATPGRQRQPPSRAAARARAAPGQKGKGRRP